MKIIKRLPLISTITNRILAPKPYDSWVQRHFQGKKYPRNLTPQQQLIKYGYTHKPRMTPLHLFLITASISLAFLTHIYLTTIYKNQLKVRHKYRIDQIQHSSIQLRIRRLIFVMTEYIEKNVFITDLLLSNQTKNVHTISQALIRTEQYRHYMKNKDRKFQFMDIGVMERYPFPDLKD